LLTTFSRASASENVPEAERPNGRVAEGRAARTHGVAFNKLVSCCTNCAYSIGRAPTAGGPAPIWKIIAYLKNYILDRIF
jgi:hypothetical protein